MFILVYKTHENKMSIVSRLVTMPVSLNNTLSTVLGVIHIPGLRFYPKEHERYKPPYVTIF